MSALQMAAQVLQELVRAIPELRRVIDASPEMRDRLKAADLLLKAARPSQTAQSKAAAELDMEDGYTTFTLVLGETLGEDLRDDDD